MWHEARKQEKKIRGLLVDYKRRAERRREYYERIKLDPTQFIQLHGRMCKIHLDPAIHHAAEAPGSMMPWRGDKDCVIDRFDVRAHLDETPCHSTSALPKSSEELVEDRRANYERYRILVQNEFLGITEEKFLNQIRQEELFGPLVNKTIEEEKKLLAPKKAAIAFCYDKNVAQTNETETLQSVKMEPDKEEDSDDSDSELDLDLTVDVISLNASQYTELNTLGMEYGMEMEDFMCLMQKDLDETESLRIAKEHEDEKAMYSGRKSRKERRALKKKHLDRRLSPPSYAARASPTYQPYQRSSSRSRSASPATATTTTHHQIKYITSFGGDSDVGSSEEKPSGSRCNDHGKRPPVSRQSPSRRSGSRHQNRSSRSHSPLHSRSHRRDRPRSKRSPDHKVYSSRTRYSPSKGSSRSTKPSSHSSKSSNRSETTSKPPSPPVRRYYGRRGGKSDTEDEDSDNSTNSSNVQSNYVSVSSLSSKGSESTGSKSAMGRPTPQELLRRKMQVLLKKQYKEDKKMQLEKAQKAQQERLDREEELRGISIKMRRRERERRHRMMDNSDSDSVSRSPSPKRWHGSDDRHSKERERRVDDSRDTSHRYRDTQKERHSRYRPSVDSEENSDSRDGTSQRRLVDY